jgi:predicted ribosome quality control (RQC) complex YloA/Tae2 family protein
MVRFREHVLSSGLRVFGGRNAENNDELVKNAKMDDVMLHTDLPGSPFVNVGTNPSKKDLYEAAVFCARHSQAWRDAKKDVVVNRFIRCDMHKSIDMKDGTWSVVKQNKIKVKKIDIERFENETH